MATSSGYVTEPVGQTEVFPWLKNLPSAPVYRPTLAEFQDPIAYIFKIEKEASMYGICKIIPPVPSSHRKTAISNLNKSLSARSTSGSPTFTTRQQQIGFCPRKPRPVQKPVWQSGENYTFQDFEVKAKIFERNYIRKYSKKATLSPLEIETLYWKATVDKPFTVEYANDIPGSAFSIKKSNSKELNENVTLDETEWNMRSVSRAKGSLLRFMKEEIPGVTSPMIYVAMLFSWFAWHVEDHDLHSLNYLHTGAGKTWYGVPREAAVAFEEVVRDHGYSGEFNPLVTFQVLGEKTTIMSPEVFISAGIPCCRLVQNPGEFVVTFPRAYHSGFSHGFNCGEAANIATPDWLIIAKDAAIRRASINYSPMVSHFQLLYDLALELCSRIPVSITPKPRSSRLKDKQKGEGETLVKEQFARNLIHNNELLHFLGKGSSVVLLPRSSSDISVCSNLRVGSWLRLNSSLGFCSSKGIMKSSKGLSPDEAALDGGDGINQAKGLLSVKEKFASLCERNRFSSLNGDENQHSLDTSTKHESAPHGDKLSDQRLFSCVTCGILSFDCIAIIQPTETAARYLMSADCSFFNDWIVGSGVTNGRLKSIAGDTNTFARDPHTGLEENNALDSLVDVPVQSVNLQSQKIDQNQETSNAKIQTESSALGLLALNYGNSSDSEEDQDEPGASHCADIIAACSSGGKYDDQNSALPSFKQEGHHDDPASHTLSSSKPGCGDKASLPTDVCLAEHENGQTSANFKLKSDETPDCSVELKPDSLADMESNGFDSKFRNPQSITLKTLNCAPAVNDIGNMKFSKVLTRENGDISFTQRSDEDSSRMHVFCLEHAVEVEQQLRSIGGVHVLLLCHPDYPRLEAEAKLVSEDLGIDHFWNNIAFRDASENDEENIQSALDSEEVTPGNGDWAVKLGINLFYSANLSRSSLYSKQMPYNSVIYKAFGRMSSSSSPIKVNIYGGRSGRQRKVVAGRWCGKVWMSNQVHPFLSMRDFEDQYQEADENIVRKTENSQRTQTTLAALKSGRKRKMTASNRSIKKVKSPGTEDADSDELEEKVTRKQHTKVYSRRQTKRIEREVSSDSLDNSRLHHGRVQRSKHAKSSERGGSFYDNILGANSNQRRKLARNKQVKSIESENDGSDALEGSHARKLHCRIPKSRKKQVKYERKSEISDDSREGNNHEWHGRISRRSQDDVYQSESALSAESLQESSYQSLGTICGSKQAEYLEHEEAISDASIENCSLQQNRRFSRGTSNKYFEREDEVSDDMPNESTYRQQTESQMSKKNKIVQEGDDSDDLLDDDSQQQGSFGSKQHRFVGRDDGASDDSLEDSYLQQQQQPRISTSKKDKFVENEDAVSEDMEEDTRLKHLRIPRSKKAKLMERDFADDWQEDDSQWEQRKTPASSFERVDVSDEFEEEDGAWQSRKTTNRVDQTIFYDSEDEVSDDLLEDNSKQNKILRSKQKSGTLPKLKQETLLQQLKQGTSGTKKKETLKSIKQAKHMLHGTPRLRNGKSENAEEDLEGGPSSRLRQRPSNSKSSKQSIPKQKQKLQSSTKKAKNVLATKPLAVNKKNVKSKGEDAAYQCDIDGCTMTFSSKHDLALHRRNICPVKGCGKTLFAHKYLVQHCRVHSDERPLKCPWKGCKRTFKWAWARTEHKRVHTGERPYVCAEEGCGQTFRFVSDFSRHKRKTGHSVKKCKK